MVFRVSDFAAVVLADFRLDLVLKLLYLPKSKPPQICRKPRCLTVMIKDGSSQRTVAWELAWSWPGWLCLFGISDQLMHFCPKVRHKDKQ